MVLKSHRILLLMHESVVFTLHLIHSWSEVAFNKYIILIINDLEASVGASTVSVLLSCKSMGVAELADISEVLIVVVVVNVVVAAHCLLRLLFVTRLPEVALGLNGHFVSLVRLLEGGTQIVIHAHVVG